jgi:hypothetical protein
MWPAKPLAAARALAAQRSLIPAAQGRWHEISSRCQDGECRLPFRGGPGRTPPRRVVALAGTEPAECDPVASHRARPASVECVGPQSRLGKRPRLPNVQCANGEAGRPSRSPRRDEILGLRKFSDVPVREGNFAEVKVDGSRSYLLMSCWALSLSSIPFRASFWAPSGVTAMACSSSSAAPG